MKKIYSCNFSKISRFITLFLCVIMLFCLVARPITAKASAAMPMYDIAMNYQDVAQVAPYLLPFILLLIGVDWYYSNIDMIIAKAEELEANCADFVRTWASNISFQIIDGTSAFKIPFSVKEELNKRLPVGNKIDDDRDYMLVPPDLLALESLNPADVLSKDVGGLIQENSGLIEDNNELTAETNSILGNIKTFFGSLIYEMQNMWSKISSGLNSRLNSIIEHANIINNNMMSHLNTLIDHANIININMMNRLDKVKEGLGDLRTALYSKLDYVGEIIKNTRIELRDSVVSMKNTLNNRIVELQDSVVSLPSRIASSFSGFFDTIVARFDSLISLVGTTNPPNNNKQEDELLNQTNGGKDHAIVVIGQGKDLLSKYKTAFLAVGVILTKFLNIPVVGDLVQFGLALGVFALIVNLGNTLVSKSNVSSSKGKHAGSAKGG